MVELMTATRRRKTRLTMIGGALAASAMLAGGCSGTLEDVWPGQQPSYKSSRSAPPLEVPPDLTSSSMQDSLRIPGVDATYSQYASGEGSAETRTAPVVLPEIDNARIERSAGQRWLIIAMKPEEVWPRLRDFWIGQGFALESEEPQIGVMETDWAEVRTPLPAGALKRMLNALDDALYGVSVRDQYRTRIERGAEPGTVEIYISHRGAEQMVVGDETHQAQREGLGERVWQPRPNDPGLEAEMLYRLMVFLGADEQRASSLVAERAAVEPRAHLMHEDGGVSALTLDADFSRGWRRTSLALDRAGFTVEDRDRSRGLFFVRYADPGDDARSEEAGWLSNLKFWESDDGVEQGDDAYVIRVIGETPEATRVVVLDSTGTREDSPVARRILTLLHEQLE